jgi:hypothetical protein
MRSIALFLLLPLLMLAAAPVAAQDANTTRYVVGDIIGDPDSPDAGVVVAAVIGPLGEEGTLYRTYEVARVSGRWEIAMFWHGDLELTDRQADRFALRRIAHADPVVVIITDSTITGGDMLYYGLSLAEVRAGVLYAVEPAPGESSGYPNVYVVGDILGNVTDPTRGSVVSQVYESDGATWYRVYFDAVRSGDRWILDDFYNNDMAFTASLLDQNDMRRVAHADPHTVIINDSMTSTGEIGWYRLSLAEFIAGKNYDHMGAWHFNTGDILGNDTAPTRYIVANATPSDSGPSQYTLRGVVGGADGWEIPAWVTGGVPLEVPLGAQLGDLAFNLVDHTDPHFAIVTDAAVENGVTYDGLSLGEILEGLNGYPPERSGPTPFKPMTVPGRIEAEDYDLGGEGVAYHDTTPGNLGGVYRQDDVDIETTAGEGTPNVGWIRDTEWLDYTVNVTTAGPYTLTARVASPKSGRTAVLFIDGVEKATIAVPNTGSFAKFASVSVPVTLEAGTHTLQLFFSGDGMNVNWLDFAPTNGTPGPTPYKPLAIPGTIEAEDYDLGGEGVAYHDTTPGNLGGAYRQDDVDIETVGGVTNVGWIRNGEYLTWTATVQSAGAYTMTARVASPNSGRTAALSVDGAPAGTIAVPNTGSFRTFTTVQVPVTLPAGTHTLKLAFSGDGQNLDRIAFAAGTVTTPTPTPTPTPVGDGASFVAVPTTAPHGSAFKFTVTPAAGKSIRSAWWSFDAPAHLNTWNSRATNPTFYYFVPGTYSPLVRLTYTDGTTEEVRRADYIRST